MPSSVGKSKQTQWNFISVFHGSTTKLKSVESVQQLYEVYVQLMYGFVAWGTVCCI